MKQRLRWENPNRQKSHGCVTLNFQCNTRTRSSREASRILYTFSFNFVFIYFFVPSFTFPEMIFWRRFVNVYCKEQLDNKIKFVYIYTYTFHFKCTDITRYRHLIQSTHCCFLAGDQMLRFAHHQCQSCSTSCSRADTTGWTNSSVNYIHAHR